MHLNRAARRRLRASLYACALLLAAAAPAHAATAPVLVGPEGGASFTEGGTLAFAWTGDLQGDPDTLARSFFRVELSPESDVPDDQQAAWTSLSNYMPTPSGQSETSAQMGVPSAGRYRWRVCAYGVEDDSVSNALTQLPGGCSTSRKLVSAAAAASNPPSALVTMTNRRDVQAPDTRIARTTASEPSVQETIEQVKTLPSPTTKAGFDAQEGADRASQLGSGGSSALSGIGGGEFGEEGQDHGEESGGIFGGVGHALSLSLPGVPIPFWSLGLLLVALPLVWFWNRSTLGMFDWPVGTHLSDLDDEFKGTSFDDDGVDVGPYQTEDASSGTLAA